MKLCPTLGGLAPIISSFTRTQKELETFLEKNRKQIGKTETKLKKLEADQTQARNINQKLKEFLS